MITKVDWRLLRPCIELDILERYDFELFLPWCCLLLFLDCGRLSSVVKIMAIVVTVLPIVCLVIDRLSLSNVLLILCRVVDHANFWGHHPSILAFTEVSSGNFCHSTFLRVSYRGIVIARVSVHRLNYGHIFVLWLELH